MISSVTPQMNFPPKGDCLGEMFGKGTEIAGGQKFQPKKNSNRVLGEMVLKSVCLAQSKRRTTR